MSWENAVPWLRGKAASIYFSCLQVDNIYIYENNDVQLESVAPESVAPASQKTHPRPLRDGQSFKWKLGRVLVLCC